VVDADSDSDSDSGQHYRAVVDDLAEGVIVQDLQGRLVASNAAARSILGLVVDEVTGRTFSDPERYAVWADGDVARSEDHPGVIARTTGQPVTGVIMGVRHVSGTTRWLNVSALPLRDPTDATVTGAVISFADITEARPSGEGTPSDAIVRRSLDAMLDPFGDERYRGLEPSLVWAMEQQMHILDSATRLAPEPRAAAVRCALALRQTLVEMGAIVSELRPPARHAGGASGEPQRPGRSFDGVPQGELTEREREVVWLVAQGHDNRTICRELYLAEVTVKKHVQRIMGKLGAANRTQAAIIAVRLGLDRDPASLDG
jgi:PAS domain S-box-containing protein